MCSIGSLTFEHLNIHTMRFYITRVCWLWSRSTRVCWCGLLPHVRVLVMVCCSMSVCCHGQLQHECVLMCVCCCGQLKHECVLMWSIAACVYAGYGLLQYECVLMCVCCHGQLKHESVLMWSIAARVYAG